VTDLQGDRLPSRPLIDSSTNLGIRDLQGGIMPSHQLVDASANLDIKDLQGGTTRSHPVLGSFNNLDIPYKIPSHPLLDSSMLSADTTCSPFSAGKSQAFRLATLVSVTLNIYHWLGLASSKRWKVGGSYSLTLLTLFLIRPVHKRLVFV